jgi:hypothetical protein
MTAALEVNPALSNVTSALHQNYEAIGRRNDTLSHVTLQATKFLFDRG